MKPVSKCLAKLSLIIIFVSSFVNDGYAGEPKQAISFSSITVDEGLSNNTVYDVVQDSLGCLWIATPDGLNKYDGYRFTVYNHDIGNPKKINTKHIRCLHINKQQQLLIGTRLGLSVYDIETDTFSNYPLTNRVNRIVQQNDSIYYVLSHNTLYQVNLHSKQLEALESKETGSFNAAAIYEGKLLVGTSNGLFFYNKNNKQLEIYYNETSKSNILDIQIYSDTVWIATEGDGLFRVSKNGEVNNFRTENTAQLSSDQMRRLLIDSKRRLWIVTAIGIDILDLTTQQFVNYANKTQNPMQSIFEDSQGGIWVGAYQGGLNYYHPLQHQFSRIQYGGSTEKSLISCIVNGTANDIWIGTNQQGLKHYNADTKNTVSYRQNNKLLANDIKALLVDNQQIYIGSYGGGVGKLDLNTNKITNFVPSSHQPINEYVYSLVKDTHSRLWIATLGGISLYDIASNSFISLESIEPRGDYDMIKELSKKRIYNLFLDSNNRIWIGAEHGIFIYHLNSNVLASYTPDVAEKDVRPRCFYEDTQHNIWMGTEFGLYKIEPNLKSVKTYTTQNGFDNDNILGILQDQSGKLWISCYNGLVRFEPQTEEVKIYKRLHDTSIDIYNSSSACQTPKGEMFFGGNNGITHFYPQQIGQNPYSPSPIITDIRVFNQPILPNSESNILSKSIAYTQDITLQPQQSTFSVRFAVPNYLSNKRNTFAYKLEGVDEEWNYIKNPNYVSYSNLKHGSYTLLVKVANNDGTWNPTPTQLSITLLPHWWQTIWARLLFVGLILAIIYLVVRFILKREALKNQIEIERIEKESAEELNLMQHRFFINITHEFKTPLTLILSPVSQLLKRNTQAWESNQLQIIQKNANKLLYLVNQLIDLRRTELGVFSLKVEMYSPAMQIQDILEMFRPLANQHSIDFQFKNNIGTEQLAYDMRYLDIMLSNLLSNAFKFCADEDSITISLSKNKDMMQISVADTGRGIDEKNKAKIFDRFYKINKGDKGTGVGLSLVKQLVEQHHGHIEVESTLGVGTTFTITLPCNISSYTATEIADEEEPKLNNDTGTVTNPTLDSSSSEAEDTNSNSTHLPKLLVVEDDVDIANYIEANFQNQFIVYKAYNGEDGLKMLKEVNIDFIITDLMLPVLDGIQLSKKVKQNIQTSHIPIIMLTAKSDQESELEGLSVGVDDYIAKPFDISILKTKVSNMLKYKARLQEYYSNSMDIEPDKIAFNKMDEEFLEKAKAIVLENLSNSEFSVHEFSQQMAMSRSNLHLKMKAITDDTVVDFIKKIRFNHACTLLKDGRYSIADISEMVGFSSASYFSTSFKQYFNIAPTDYIKKQNRML